MYEPRALSFLWLLLIFDSNVNATSVTLCAAMDDLFDFDVYDEEPDTVDGEHSQATASSHMKAKTSKPKSGCKRLLKKDKLSIASKLRAVDSYEQLLSIELHLFEFPERSEILIHLIDSS